MFQNMFIFFCHIAWIFTSHYLMLYKCRRCYFSRDSTEVSTGFLAVTPLPHLNRPPSRGKTGGQFICKWRDWETKKGRKRRGAKRLDGLSGNLRPVFVWFQTADNNHTLSGIPDAKNISRHSCKWVLRSHQNRMCEYFNLLMELVWTQRPVDTTTGPGHQRTLLKLNLNCATKKILPGQH